MLKLGETTNEGKRNLQDYVLQTNIVYINMIIKQL